jgi:hypothetical protein
VHVSFRSRDSRLSGHACVNPVGGQKWKLSPGEDNLRSAIARHWAEVIEPEATGMPAYQPCSGNRPFARRRLSLIRASVFV